MEEQRRRDTWQDGNWLKLGDGEWWSFPAMPGVTLRTDATLGQVGLGQDMTHALLAEVLATDGIGEPRTFATLFDVARHLLAMHYDVSDAEADALLPFGPHCPGFEDLEGDRLDDVTKVVFAVRSYLERGLRTLASPAAN